MRDELEQPSEVKQEEQLPKVVYTGNFLDIYNRKKVFRIVKPFSLIPSVPCTIEIYEGKDAMNQDIWILCNEFQSPIAAAILIAVGELASANAK